MIDFKTATDSGYNTEDSIQPVSNGEIANQTVFRRPSENLRKRTEAVRKGFELADYVDKFYGRLQINTQSPQTRIRFVYTVGSGYRFYLRNDDAFDPPSSNVGLSISGFFPDPVKFSQTAFSWMIGEYLFGFTVKTKKTAIEGGNNIFFKVVIQGSGNSVVLTTTPPGGNPADGPILITATCGSEATLQDLQNAFIGHEFLEISYSVDTSVVAIDEIRIGTSRSGSPLATGHSAVEPTYLSITSTILNNLFSTKFLNENDVVGVAFDSVDALLKCTATTDLGSQVVILRAADNFPVVCPGLADGLFVPIAKVDGVGTNAQLVFIDGRTFPTYDILGHSIYFDAGTIEERISVGAKTGTPISLNSGTLNNQLSDFLAEVNNHLQGTDYKHSLKDITSKPFVTVGSTGCDYTTLESAVDALVIMSTGGIIFLTEDVTVNNTIDLSHLLSHAIYVFGNGHSITLATGQLFSCTTAGMSDPGFVYFSNCKFFGNSTSVFFSSTHRGNFIFEDCLIDGFSSTPWILFHNAKSGSLKFKRCYINQIEGHSTIVEDTGLTGTKNLNIMFEDCILTNIMACNDTNPSAEFAGDVIFKFVNTKLTFSTTSSAQFFFRASCANPTISFEKCSVVLDVPDDFVFLYSVYGTANPVNLSLVLRDSSFTGLPTFLYCYGCKTAKIDNCRISGKEITTGAKLVYNYLAVISPNSMFSIENTVLETFEILFQRCLSESMSLRNCSIKGSNPVILSAAGMTTGGKLLVDRIFYETTTTTSDSVVMFGLPNSPNYKVIVQNSVFQYVWRPIVISSDVDFIFQNNSVLFKNLSTVSIIDANKAKVINNVFEHSAASPYPFTGDSTFCTCNEFSNNQLSFSELSTSTTVDFYAVEAEKVFGNTISAPAGGHYLNSIGVRGTNKVTIIGNKLVNCRIGVFCKDLIEGGQVIVNNNYIHVSKYITRNAYCFYSKQTGDYNHYGTLVGNILEASLTDGIAACAGIDGATSGSRLVKLSIYNNVTNNLGTDFIELLGGSSEAYIIAASEQHYYSGTPTLNEKIRVHQIAI